MTNSSMVEAPCNNTKSMFNPTSCSFAKTFLNIMCVPVYVTDVEIVYNRKTKFIILKIKYFDKIGCCAVGLHWFCFG